MNININIILSFRAHTQHSYIAAVAFVKTYLDIIAQRIVRPNSIIIK